MFTIDQVRGALAEIFGQDEPPHNVKIDEDADVVSADWGDHTFAVIPHGLLVAHLNGETYDSGPDF